MILSEMSLSLWHNNKESIFNLHELFNFDFSSEIEISRSYAFIV